MALDEKALRRETFEEGRAVTLADGQDWILPRPRVRYVPDDGPVGFKVRLGLDVGYQELIDAASNAESGTDVVKAELALGRALLLHNYNLAPDQLADLLQFSWDDTDVEGSTLRTSVLDVAFGIAPKPSAAGAE